MDRRPLLFIGHSAGRTGAPLNLLYLLRWLRDNGDLPFQVVLREGGALEANFRDLAPVTMLGAGVRKLRGGRLGRLGFDRLFDQMDAWQLQRQYHNGEFGLIYSNTVTNGRVLNALAFLDCPVISHVHELEYWIQHRVGLASFDLVKRYTRQYIAVSEAVQDNLIRNHGIARQQIDRIYGFISLDSVQSVDLQNARTRVRDQLNIPREAFVVGASGVINWWKGPDLFVKLAQEIYTQRLAQPVYFVWVGGSECDSELVPLRRTIAAAGLSEYVKFVSTQPEPMNFFAAFDVFALTSRSDSFPLVVLESAALGKPTVCFDETGGAREFVGDDCGVIVPHLNVQTMAEAVMKLLDSVELRERLGQNARRKVQDYDVSVVAPKIWALIQRSYLP